MTSTKYFKKGILRGVEVKTNAARLIIFENSIMDLTIGTSIMVFDGDKPKENIIVSKSGISGRKLKTRIIGVTNGNITRSRSKSQSRRSGR